jgi:succinyl-CoA synthetase beta subunit
MMPGERMGLIDYAEAHKLLQKYGIRSVESKYVTSAKDAISFSKGKPIVLKAISQKALHKSRSGLVALNLSSDKEITLSYNQLAKRAQKFKPYKMLAQQMVRGGTEIIIGGKIDPQFGKMVLLGLGGIYVETFKDFALRLCPITKYDAISMLKQLRSSAIVAPDKKTAERITELLLKTSRMYTENNITELDLNPVLIHDGTYDAVDLRMIR